LCGGKCEEVRRYKKKKKKKEEERRKRKKDFFVVAPSDLEFSSCFSCVKV